MSRAELCCPSCGAILGFRRNNGNVRPRSTVERADAPDDVYLRCGACGGRLLVENVAVVLMNRRPGGLL